MEGTQAEKAAAMKAMEEAGMDASEVDESEMGPAVGDMPEHDGEVDEDDDEFVDEDEKDDEDGEEEEHEEDEEDEAELEDLTNANGEEEPFIDDNPSEFEEREEDSVWEDEHLSAEQFASIHKKVDASGDGKISLPELLTFSQVARRAVINQEVNEGFLQIDSNDDGKISLDELLENTVGGPHRPEDNTNMEPQTAEELAEQVRTTVLETAKFKAADHNKDGFLDKDESIPVLYPEFNDGMLELIAASAMKVKDKNGDGELEHGEFWHTTHDEFDPEFEQSKIQDALDNEKADFEKVDLDKNGKINVEELKRWESGRFHTEDAMKSLFELADDDENGLVTQNELKKSVPHLANHIAIPHLKEWVAHYEL